MAAETDAIGHAGDAAEPTQEIICGCRSYTLRQMRALLAARPELGFDQFIRETGAGSVCTACLLDLEYHFVTAPRSRGQIPQSDDDAADNTGQASAKQRFYRRIDSLSPVLPFPLRNIMPVVAGPGIEQFACVANQSLLFEGAECAPRMEVELVVRDRYGALRHRHVEYLDAESMLRVNVSRYLNTGRPELEIGSVLISRRAETPGIRGTTRPQVEIVARAGACALHGQAATRAREGWVTVLCRPSEERLFLSLLNATARPLTIELAYPFPITGEAGDVETRRIDIPGHGAQLHEIALRPEIAERLRGTPYSIRWRAAGTYKVHILCATPALDRFSIDHL